MKGQLSLEYLVVSVVALGLLAISLTALSAVRENSARSFSLLEFRNDADRISASVNEACALGEGNYIAVHIHTPVSVSCSDGIMTVSSEGHSKSFDVPCDVEGAELEQGRTSVGVDGGFVVFG